MIENKFYARAQKEDVLRKPYSKMSSGFCMNKPMQIRQLYVCFFFMAPEFSGSPCNVNELFGRNKKWMDLRKNNPLKSLIEYLYRNKLLRLVAIGFEFLLATHSHKSHLSSRPIYKLRIFCLFELASPHTRLTLSYS